MAELRSLLEKAGLSDVNAVTEFGKRTALHLAAWSGDHDLCRAVLACKEFKRTCDPDSVGRTALHLAISAMHLSFEEIRSILERGPIVLSAADRLKRVPLHYAAKRGDAALCSLLLEWGAVIDATDKGMWTPLHHAADAGHLAVCEVLGKAGGKGLVLFGDKDGITPKDLAQEKGHTAVCEALESYQHQEAAAPKPVKGKESNKGLTKGGGKENSQVPAANQTAVIHSDIIPTSKSDFGFEDSYLPRYQIVDIGGGDEDDINELEWPRFEIEDIA